MDGRQQWTFVALAFSVFFAVAAAGMGGTSERTALCAISWLLMVVAASRLRGGDGLLLVLCFTALGTATHVLCEPFSSSDVYRYLWEGRVVTAGENPYAYPPDSSRFVHLRDRDVHPQVQHASIATIYPPLAQGFFAAGHTAGGTPQAFKALLIVCWLCAVAAVGRREILAGRNHFRTGLLAGHPLVVLEAGEAGHIDAFGAALLLAAFTCPPRFLQGFLVGASVFVKPVAWPLCLVASRSGRALVGVIVAGAIGVLSLAGVILPEFGRELPLTSADGRSRLAFTDRWNLEQVGFVEPFAPVESVDRVLGRYTLVQRDDPKPVEIAFDASQTALLTRDDETTDLGFYVDGGQVVVWDRSDQSELFSLRMSADRLVLHDELRGTYALKNDESPLLGLSQYSWRWAGFAPVHAWGVRLFGDRTRYHVAIAGLSLLLALLLFWKRVSLPAASLPLGVLALCALPVLYPWYFLWLLPGAALVARPSLACFLSGLLAAAPLIHLLH